MKSVFTFSLISFAYNEEKILESQMRLWNEKLNKFCDDYEIVLVNDGSTDATGTIADRLAEEMPALKVIHHKENMGVGHALRTAREKVTKDYVFWNDVDGHFDLDDLEKVVPFLKDNDIVIAFKHDTLKTKSPFNWLKSRVNYYLIRLLFWSYIRDFQFVQFFPREFFQNGIKLESFSSFIPAECLVKATSFGLRIAQIQLFYHSHHRHGRVSKSSKVNMIFTSIRNIFSFWIGWNFLGKKQEAIRLWNERFDGYKPWQK